MDKMKSDQALEQIAGVLASLYPHGHPDFIPMTLAEVAVHSKKNKDYAYGGDPLGNFKRVSNILKNYPNLPLDNPVVIAILYSLKQLDAALWMLANGYEGEIEGLDSRLMDVHVYNKLARLLAYGTPSPTTPSQCEQNQPVTCGGCAECQDNNEVAGSSKDPLDEVPF